jgi:LacI family transcriptional regulator
MKRITMSDIGQKAGVSKNTVSLALRNDPQIPEATRLRIQKLAEKLGYQVNPIVANLMAQLRSSQQSPTRATLALINANADQDAFTQHPTIPNYVKGCKRRAKHLGYALDNFWLNDPELDAKRLHRILKARGIRGAVIVGLMNNNRLPQNYNLIWENFPCVVTGVRTRKPALSFACTDHHIIALRAFENALALGYQRPGLVLDQTIDDLVEGRFSAGYHIGQHTLPIPQRLRPFYQIAAATKDRTQFHAWLKKEQPDVIFTLYNGVRAWVEEAGMAVPEDIGLIQLEWRPDRPEWAGMDQHNDLSGEAAIDMVIGMIHGNESGVPPFPRATLISGTWVNGQTVRPQ